MVAAESPDRQDETAMVQQSELKLETLMMRLKDSGAFVSDPVGEAGRRMEAASAEIKNQFSSELGDFIECNDAGADRLRRFTQITRNTIAKRSASKQFAVAKGGLMLLVLASAKKGDIIVVFGEARVPYLLRPCGRGCGSDEFTIVGEAYVHGFGRGTLLACPEARESSQWFIIR